MTESKLYQIGQRECWKLGDHYTRNSLAMTAEGLHKKSDIAAELAVRDAEIERLRDLLRRAAEVVDGCCRCLDYSPVGKEVEAELHPSDSIGESHDQ